MWCFADTFGKWSSGYCPIEQVFFFGKDFLHVNAKRSLSNQHLLYRMPVVDLQSQQLSFSPRTGLSVIQASVAHHAGLFNCYLRWFSKYILTLKFILLWHSPHQPSRGGFGAASDCARPDTQHRWELLSSHSKVPYLLDLMRCLHFICSESLMWRHLILWSGRLFAWIVLYKLAKIIIGEWSFFHQLGTAKSMHSFSLLQLAI